MKKENVVVTCPPCGENVGLPTKRGLLNKEAFLTPPHRPYGALPPQVGKLTTRGFTLIELLVVVLIIGILAAVAVPQYQKAVDKSYYMQSVVNIKEIYKALEVYRLENGSYPDSSLEKTDDPSVLSSVLHLDIPPLRKFERLYYRPKNNYVGYYKLKDPLWITVVLNSGQTICDIPSGSVTARKVSICKALCTNPPNYAGSGSYTCYID